MAKKTSRKSPTATKSKAISQTPDTVTVGTRLSIEQRQLVEKAAKAADMSPAKFIRQAAIDRAADVINADGDSVQALRRLASLVVEQLRNPSVIDCWQAHEPDPDPATAQDEYSWQDLDSSDGLKCHMAEHEIRFHDGWRYLHSVPKRPSELDLEQVHTALQTAGTVLVEMMLEQWESAFSRPNDYRPTVWKDRVTKDDIDE